MKDRYRSQLRMSAGTTTLATTIITTTTTTAKAYSPTQRSQRPRSYNSNKRLTGGASDYFSKYKARRTNQPQDSQDLVDESPLPPTAPTTTTTITEMDFMSLSPSKISGKSSAKCTHLVYGS